MALTAPGSNSEPPTVSQLNDVSNQSSLGAGTLFHAARFGKEIPLIGPPFNALHKAIGPDPDHVTPEKVNAAVAADKEQVFDPFFEGLENKASSAEAAERAKRGVLGEER
jgi:hypothetical protein